jgi:hypothetical protein
MGSQQDRERVMAGFNLIKTQYTDVWNTTVKSFWTMNIHIKIKDRNFK